MSVEREGEPSAAPFVSDPARSELSASAPLSARALLAAGVGSAPADALRKQFELPENASDALLARVLLRRVVEEDVHALGVQEGAHAPGHEAEDPSLVVSVRASYLMRLPTSARPDALSVDGLHDVRSLLAVARAGSLRQRRAAIRRVGELLVQDVDMTAALRKRAIDTLIELGTGPLAYEATRVLASLSGSEGRSARAEHKTWTELVARVSARIVAFWDGQEHEEPIGALAGEERALLFSKARDLPELVVRHVSAVLEDSAGQPDQTLLRAFVRAIEHAGDARLLPALRCVIEAHETDLIASAARCLASSDDPRAHVLLKSAYDRAVRAEERLALAGALGAVGDARGQRYAREVLAGDDTALIPAAICALADLGSTDDVQRLCELLDSASEPVVRAAVTTLGRIADSRALVPLARLRERTQRSSSRAEIEEAESAIHARMELLGEEAAPGAAASVTWDTTKTAALARSKDPALVRARVFVHLVLAYFWQTVGAHTRAIARFEASATLRSGAVEPVLAVAMLRSRRGETAQALSAFRRAVQIDRAYIEAHRFAIAAMAQAFLRRAEAMEREGRVEIARGLTEEILAFDLRRASDRVRFALRERSEARAAKGS